MTGLSAPTGTKPSTARNSHHGCQGQPARLGGTCHALPRPLYFAVFPARFAAGAAFPAACSGAASFASVRARFVAGGAFSAVCPGAAFFADVLLPAGEAAPASAASFARAPLAGVPLAGAFLAVGGTASASFTAAFFAGVLLAGAFLVAGGTASASAVRSTTESSPPKSLQT